MTTNYRTQIRKNLRKAGYKVIFTSTAKLKNILCNNNSELLPNSYTGVFVIVEKNIGEIKKRVLNRSIEHQEDTVTEKWEASGATEHSKGLIGCTQKRLQN